MFVQLGSGGAKEKERNALRPVRQVLEEREEGSVCPVQVLETEHGRALRGKRLQEAPPGGKRLLLGSRLRRGTDQRGQAGLEPGTVGIFVGQGALELGRGLVRGVGLEDAALGLQHLAQGPEGDALPVGQAAALAPSNQVGALPDVPEELGAETALAHARLANDRDQLAGALLGSALEGADQERPLQLPADQRSRVRAG